MKTIVIKSRENFNTKIVTIVQTDNRESNFVFFFSISCVCNVLQIMYMPNNDEERCCDRREKYKMLRWYRNAEYIMNEESKVKKKKREKDKRDREIERRIEKERAFD